MQSAPYVVATGTLQGRSHSFSNLGGAEGGAAFLGLGYESCMLKQCFTVSRTVELLSEGASKLVLTLESIGGSENSSDEHVCETTEAWHGSACTVLLRSAFACVFGLIFRFSCHSIWHLRY